MLSFVESLKHTISHIQHTEGAIIEHALPPDMLLQKLREYAVKQMSVSNTPADIFLEWFTGGLFSEHVRVCFVHLAKLGIVDEETSFKLICKTIDARISGRNPEPSNRTFDEYLEFSLFEVWDALGDEQTRVYTFAKKRSLIAWNYQQGTWRTTSLGVLLLNLSPVQAATFLLSIDTQFSTGRRDLHHISSNVLYDILSVRGNDEYPEEPSYSHREILTQLGLLIEQDEYTKKSVELSRIGKSVVRRVLAKDNPFRDTVRVLLETEEEGFVFDNPSTEIKELREEISKSTTINEINKGIIITALDLYQQYKYVESLRTVIPSIEYIFDVLLSSANEVPSSFNGMHKKLQKIEQLSLLPRDMTSAIEVITARNKILHGNFTPSQNEYAYPLCMLVFLYMSRLIKHIPKTV